jgi:streptogramin lyase
VKAEEDPRARRKKPDNGQQGGGRVEQHVAVAAPAIGSERHARLGRSRRLPALVAALISLLVLAAAGLLLARDLHPTWRVSSPAHPAAQGYVAQRQVGPVHEYSMLSPAAGLMMPAVARNGQVWVGEMNLDRLAVLDPRTGVMREYHIPGSGFAGVMGIAADARGRIWYTATSRGALGDYDPASRTFHEISTPSRDSAPNGIAVDGAGNVWFTELNRCAIGRLDAGKGTIDEWSISSSAGCAPYWLTFDAAGNVWFTEFAASKIGELIPASGEVHEWSTPTSGSEPTGIAVAPNGTVWFSESDVSRLGELIPASGQMTDYPLPAATRPYGLVVAHDGSIWLAGTVGSVLTRYSPPSGRFAQLTLPTPSAGIFWLTTDRNGSLWCVEGDASANKLARVSI